MLSNWISRPKPNKRYERPIIAMPGMTSAISYDINKPHDFINGSIGYLEVNGNEVSQNAKALFFCSSITAHKHGWHITKDNFTKTMIILCIRDLTKSTWINDKDQYTKPSSVLPTEFINDCVVYSLFNKRNQTSSMTATFDNYKYPTIDVVNEFFPFTNEEVYNLGFAGCCEEERFVATWLNGAILSKEAEAVVEAAKKIYACYYKEYAKLNTNKFKLGDCNTSRWDVGWYQVQQSLRDKTIFIDGVDRLFEEFKVCYNVLSEKLRPDIYKRGFLIKEEMFDIEEENNVYDMEADNINNVTDMDIIENDDFLSW